MEALQRYTTIFPSHAQFEPDKEAIKRTLIRKGVDPTPKIVHNLRKKQIQKHNRKLNRQAQKSNEPPPLTESQKQAMLEEQQFQVLKHEYKEFNKVVEALKPKESENDHRFLMVGKPWEGTQKVEFWERVRANEECEGGKLKRERLKELKDMFEARKVDELKLVFDDDIEMNELWFNADNEGWHKGKKTRNHSEADVIRFLVDRLCDREITVKDWKFSRLMKLSGLPFTEGQLMRIVELLGVKGCWKQALSAVQWVYNYKDHRKYQSRFVYTKLLSVLGKARRPREALQIFNLMRRNIHAYPDMAAYHSVAVTLGQAGLLKELLTIVECMRQKPKIFKFMRHKDWDPTLEPDLVIYNAVLNACVPTKQWKAVSWVFKQLKRSGLKPNGATYGLAMEVMLESGNYDLVHELFGKMTRSGEVPKALTYKVLVRCLWKEGKVDEAIETVREMESRGVMGAASVYYELACCLCNYGRWQDAIVEVEKIRRLSHARPLEVTFTGMIMSSMDGGHLNDCIHIFEHMKDVCTPNIGAVNTMLKVYGQNDMFLKAKELFEEVRALRLDTFTPQEVVGDGSSIIPDVYTYSAMLEASASAHQWEYFEHVYKEMILFRCKLDQNKSATVFVKASRAGKCHLLEHEFDMILEAGEIPHRMFFFELVIQAISQHNYERAVILVNTMAYAPFRVTEKQWTDMFKENKDRINHENLQRLLDSLGNCDVVSEATVSNLSRSLHVLCGLGASRTISRVIPAGIESTGNFQNDEIDSDERKDEPNISGRMMMESAELENDSSESEAFIFNNYDQDDIGENKDFFRPQKFKMEDRINYGANRLEFTDNLAPEKSSEEDGNYKDDDDDDGREYLASPPAYEILEAWKKMRKEDKYILHTELGCS
ncbi:LOW QUALITY PROTEIN: pentatricopeptide repeat-containing protein At5g67570, chloroplastic [Arachis duranensis]|uniref:LOW QUALITY PROTEIN: pentatricopeptide repeat-containing protein At5g67570, chloroplastic n=1 Tax=Arachis duranensis TaxID=130453 RepID=A0A6P4D0I3_ARADU|nr:LOW QUALITY PROTEIN: pentatricopeptide repeat-containing protein At5g67570, chloroplastic [Arachis duranensis]